MEEEKAVGGGRKLKWFLMFCPPSPASVDWEAPRALPWLSVYYTPSPIVALDSIPGVRQTGQ